jgi:hypothetical protein
VIIEIGITVVATLLVNEMTDISPWIAIEFARWAAKRIYANDKKRMARRAEDWESHIRNSLPTNLSKLCFGLSLGCAATACMALRQVSPARSALRKASPVRPTPRKALLMALVMLSQGRCYWPDCVEPCLVTVDGASVLNLQVAHICAIGTGGPRYDPSMLDLDRTAFSNLILLCAAHHVAVDRDLQSRYSATTLRKWKSDREG